ncbi:MAG: hypothetical protein LBT55_02875 [Clostridiaceae bacterium]|jgi:hypothetical protein|nr:hypothetical protein [Clostridiaceae bacterium]
MGTHDGLVDVWTVEYMREAYATVGNNAFAALNVSYAGHSCDVPIITRGGQLTLYYMELFMENLR